MLGANIIDTKTDEPYVKPYIILNREGVKIAVLGMLTPAIPNWLTENLWSGMKFENMVTSARKWMKIIQEKEKRKFCFNNSSEKYLVTRCSKTGLKAELS